MKNITSLTNANLVALIRELRTIGEKVSPALEKRSSGLEAIFKENSVEGHTWADSYNYVSILLTSELYSRVIRDKAVLIKSPDFLFALQDDEKMEEFLSSNSNLGVKRYSLKDKNNEYTPVVDIKSVVELLRKLINN